MLFKLIGRWLLAITLVFTTTQAFAAAPSVPPSISVPATATENVNYTVSWGASSGTVTRYELMGELTNLGSGNSSFRSKVRNKPAGSYCYMVRACNGDGCSAYIAKKCVNVLARTQTPVISPAPGSYTGNVTVSMSAASGATIRYTLNNSEVTASSPIYSAPFSVSSTKTVRARAFKSGMTNSTEARSVLTIYPAPVIEQFEWLPRTVKVGKPTSFYWNVKNVSSCTALSAGTGSPTTRPASGVSGPHIYSSPREHTTKWYCTDLAGKRFPQNSNEYLTAPSSVVAEPVVNTFEWSPRAQVVGQPTSFYWDVSNVSSCTALSAGANAPAARAASGVSGPHVYTSPIEHMTTWYCTDLAGGRYPESSSQYLTAPLSVVSAPVVNRFEWQYAEVEVGQPTNFYWNVANATECSEVTQSGVVKRAASGQLGPLTFAEPGQYTSKWFCKDQAGNRYPLAASSFIEATVNVIAPEVSPDADFIDTIPTAKVVTAPAQTASSASAKAVDGSFSVTNQGAASYQIPLTVLSGIGGIQPELSLNYSSLGGNGDAGLGWSLSATSAISRCQKTLEEDGLFQEITFTNTDALCLGGEKLRLVSGSNLQSGAEYRLDSQPEVKVMQSGSGASSYFTLYRPTGEQQTFGDSANSVQIDVVSGAAYSWLQSEQRNLFDQAISYEYLRQTDVAPQLQFIRYSGNEIELVYENRPDASTHYYLGNKLQYNTRLADVVLRNHLSQAVLSYHLAYRESAFSQRSLLQSVQLCNGSSNGVCSQPTTLSYSDADVAGLSASDVVIDLQSYTSVDGGGTGCNSPTYSMSGYCSVWGIKLADIDADGKKELLVSTHKGDVGKVLVFNTNNNDVQFSSLHSNLNVSLRPWRVAVSNQPVYYSFPWQLTDDDGDGNLDIIFDDKLRYDWDGDGVDELTPGKTSVIEEYAASVSWSNPDGYEWLAFPFGYYNDKQEIPLDINGDGLIDRAVPVFEYEVIYWPETGETSYTLQVENWVYEINRSVASSYIAAPELAGTTDVFRFSRNFGDVNGDGYVDISGTGSVTLNNSKGFGGLSHNFTSNIYCLGDIDCLHGLADINGDGKDDMVAVKDNIVYWNRSLSNGSESASQLTSVTWGTHKTGESSYKWEDFDGDDQPELIFFNHATQKVHIRFDRNVNNDILDKLTGIDNGLGKTFDITYKRLSDNTVYTKGTGAAAVNWGKGSKVRDIVSSMPVVATVTEAMTASATGQVRNKNLQYRYKGMKTQAGGRGALGFEEVTTEELTAGSKVVKTFRQDAPFNGMLSKSELYIGGLLSERTTVNTWWDLSSNNGQSRFIAPRKQTTNKYYLNGDNGLLTGSVLASTAVAESWYEMTADNYPKRTKTVSSVSDQFDSGSSSQTVDVEYNDEDISNWRIQRPTRTVTRISRSGELSITQTQDTVYNTNGSVQQLVREPDSNDESLYLQSFMRYDSYGNMTQQTQCSLHFATSCGDSTVPDVTDGAKKVFRRKVFGFDATGRYLTSVGNGVFTEQSFHSFNNLGQAQEVRFNQYDSRSGQREYYGFDSFGERYFSWTNQGSSTKVTKTLCASSSTCPANAVLLVTQTSPDKHWSQTYVDISGNKVREVVQLLDNRWSITDTEYDTLGRAISVSKPYVVGESAYYDSISYDALGRKATVQSADGLTTRFSYYTGKITQFISGDYSDEASSASLDRTRQEQHNGRGEVVHSTDSLSNNTYFSYNALGLPLTVTGVDNAVTTLGYDSYGRRTTMDDPDKGNIAYGFNALGEDISRTSPDGIVKTHFRNAIGQTVRSTTVQGSSTLSYLFNYANTPFLQQQSHNGSVTSYGYDSFHRPSTESYQIDGKNWSRSLHYDEYGRLFRDMDIAGNGYGQQYQYANGHLNRIFEVKTGNAYYRMLKTDAYQNLTSAKSGANIDVERDYDAKSGRLTGLFAGYGMIQYQHYRYDQLGNLRYRSNLNSLGSTDLVESFGYDVLNRLESVTFNGVLTQQMSYLDNGNILTKSDVENGAAYQYGTVASSCSVAPGEHAVSQIGTRRFCYDARGNQTHRYVGSSLTRRVDYTAFDKPHTIWSNQGESRFNYDASEKLVKRVDKKASGDMVTYYVGGHEAIFQSDGTSEIKRYIRDIAIHTIKSTGSDSLHYVFNDHLGSGSVITDKNGSIVETASFDAFGKRRNATNWQGYSNPFSQLTNLTALLNITQKGYTGHIQVDHAAVIHMGGRIYDPELGRFMQADPIVQDPRDAQSLNRYSYVYNNPLSYTDPTGYECQNQRGQECIAAVQQAKEDAAKAAQANGNSSNAEVNQSNGSADLQNTAAVANGQSNTSSSGVDKRTWDVTYSSDEKIAYINLFDSNGSKAANSGSFVITIANHDVGFEYDVLEAIDYVESSGDAVFRNLVDTGFDTVFKEFQPGTCNSCGMKGGADASRTNDTISVSNGIIRFHQFEGLSLSKGVQTPALGLAHEASHALRAITDINGFIKDKGRTRGAGQNSSDYEEHRVIRGLETNIAKSLGEPTRSWHSQGTPKKVRCVTCTN